MGHLGQQIDSWINVRFAGPREASHPGGAIFHTGAIGDAPVWQAVIEATQESRASAREFLDRLDGEQLETVVPYDGSIEYLRPTGLRLSYTLMRCAAHHFEHKGEF